MLGYSAVQLGVLARVHYNFDPGFRERLLAKVTIGRGALAAALLMAVGLVLDRVLLVDWIRTVSASPPSPTTACSGCC